MRYLVLGNQLMNNISYRDLFYKPVENTTIINSKLHHPEQIYLPKLNNGSYHQKSWSSTYF